jgi:hypothetical protein
MDKVSLNARETDTVEGIDGVGDAVDFAQYYSGMAIPQVATALISGGVGGLVGKQVVKSAVKKKLGDGLEKEAKDLLATGAKRGGYAGVGTQAIGTELGATYGQAVEEAQANGESIDDINLGRVAGYGTLAGSLELVGDVATLGLARLGPASNLIDAARKTRTRGAVTGVASGSAVEGLTEGLQTGLEDMGAGRSLEEARFFDPTSVLAGAIGGGQLGAIGGLLRRPQQSGTDTNEVLEVAKDNVGEQLQLDLDDPSTPEQIQAAQEQAQQRAEVEAQQAKIAQDADNQVLRSEAQTFSRDDFKKQRTALLEQAVDNTETDLGKEFLEVINTSTDENPRGLIDVKDIKAARTSFVKAKAAEQDGTLNVEYEAELVNRVTKKAAVSNQAELDFKQATAVEKVQAELDKPALSGTKAIEQTERMFGKDWVNSGKYDDLAAVINSSSFKQKKYAEELEKAVNPPAPTPVNTLAEDVADAAATLTAPEGLTAQQTRVFNVLADHFMGDKQYDIEKIYAGGKFLTTNIAKLAKVNDKTTAAKAITAFKTKLVENQGTVGRNTPKAEKDAAVQAVADKLAARVKEQRQEQLKGSQNQANASDAFDASVEEDTSNQTGVSIDRVKGTGKGADAALQSALKSMPEVDAPIQGTENRADADEALDNVEAMDMAELGVGGGFSTKASVGQGNYTGVAKEDQAFSKEQTTSDEEVAAVAEAQNQKIDDAVESQSAILKGVWDSGKSPDTSSFDFLDASAKREVFFIVRQYFEDSRKKGNDPKATLERARAELAQIEPTLAPVEESDTNETTIPDAEPRRPTEAEESVRQKRDASPTGDGQSGGGNVTASQEAAPSEQATQQVASKAEEKKPRRFTAEDILNDPAFINPTEEQAQNVANVRNGMLARREKKNAERRQNFPEDSENFSPEVDEDYRSTVVETKPKKKKLAKMPESLPAEAKRRSDNTKFSKKTARGEASTVARVTATADIMFGGGSVNTRAGVKIPMRSGNAYSRIQIHATEKDALRALKGSMTREDLQDAQGFIDPRDGAVSHYIAENITVGEEAGILAHEVGVHLGLEGVMDASGISKLSFAVDDWANEAEGSTARNIYDAVGVRIAFARLKGMDESLLEIEKIAYAVEEAINMGVSPDKVSQDKAAKWLADIQQFFSDLLGRFMSRGDPDPFFGLPAPVLEPTELVALAMGAARGVMNSAAVETGAVTSDMDQVAGYYGGTDRGRSLDEDAEVLSSERPGEEMFSWGKNSSIGDEKNILTVADFDRSGMDFGVFAGNTLDSPSILSVSLSRIRGENAIGYDNLYEVAVYGPMDGGTKTLDLEGKDWSRLEGVSRKDTIRVLTEARRRMTRHLSGAIPNLVWARVTGSSAKTGEARQGSRTAEELKQRFSRAPQNQTPDQKASGVAKREWVRSNLGGTNAVKAYDTASGVAAKAALSLKFVHNIVRDNRESMPSLGRWYDAMLQVEATRNEIKQSYNGIKKQARALSSERRVVVNKFLGSSTFDQQWGYDPKEYHPDVFGDKKVEVNAGKRIQFQRLSASEKQLITDIFAHGERMRQRKVALAKKLGVAGKFFTDASLEGPYAPLKRFGNYVAELKSAKLVEAGRAAKADGATKKQKELYEELKSDREHYVISFFDTEGAANQFVDENKKTYAFSPPATERTPNIDKERVSNPEVYEKVMGALAASTDASMDPSAKTAFRELVKSMYFQSMDERSARTSGTKRLNRAGYEENMLRSFESNASAEASLIAQMENGTEVNTALALAGKETRIDPNDPESIRDTEKQRVFNNIAKHYADTLTRNETPVQDMISTGNSVYMLLTSVGYHLTNATQPVMVSIPRIAGDFGSYNNAWSAMFRGYKYSRAAAKIGLNMETEIDFDKVPQEYRGLLKLLQDRNLIDQGMEEDGSFNRFNTGFEVLNRGSDMLGIATGKLYNVAKFVEAQNRISTAIAAYDAARANPTKLAAMKMTPEQYATAVVEDTQGNFSQLDAPSLIKSLPKVVTQYRKYQLLMAWHYASAYKQIRWGSPEEKAAGKRILAYSIGHAAMGAGATGVPLLTTAFWLATFLGDEDEPQDMERWIKENIDDGAFGQALSRGVFSTFGLDLSTKLNQSKIFHPLPYVDFEAGEEGARNIILGAVGPAGTTGVNFFRAAEYLKQGDLLKGIEYSMPKGIRSVAESYRLATEGMTTKSGTITVDPREFDVVSLLINAMGLPSSEINRLKWTKGQQYELEQYFNKEGGKIRKKYIEATRKRDRDGQAEMRQEFRDLQKAKDRVRPFFNDAPGALNRQSISTLLRAPRAKDRLERREQEKLR